MRRRWSGAAALVAVGLALAVSAPAAAGQGAAPPRTPDGQPDLQGVWNFSTITPLERPEEQADKAFLTAEEAAEIEQETAPGGSTRRRLRAVPAATTSSGSIRGPRWSATAGHR